jgi:hypothetical protein
MQSAKLPDQSDVTSGDKLESRVIFVPLFLSKAPPIELTAGS